MKDKEVIRQYLNSVWETMDNNPDSITREDFDRILNNTTRCRLISFKGKIPTLTKQLCSELEILHFETILNVVVKVSYHPSSEISFDYLCDLLNVIHASAPKANILWGCSADAKIDQTNFSILLLISC
ncbi:hypothetical protein B5F90_00700 [Alistipes sp. An31A]|uniref:hypothetical protein n=1 Tax=Alistipes sp. An31A TaxID=1965631 RepID=UPI000B378E6D|nr:hypothetical protein [Alistipes sp. An31A]OUO23386.1 hypothetical protein B5F90_00700 [Alistipes sp. An31A]